MSRLPNKVALVTGGGGGIARAICTTLAAEGAAIACVDVNAEAGQETVRQVEAAGGRARFYRADLSQRTQVQSLFAEVERDFGRLDVLVNNAMWIRYQPIAEVDEDTVEKMLGIGLKAIFWTTQAAAPLLSRQGGSIINLASIAAVRGTAERMVYCAVKGGVAALTLSVAAELGAANVRVNAIAPGAVLVNPATAERLGPAGIQARLDTTPLKRLGQPDDIAGVVLFLASDDSRFVTGTLIPIDGGRLITA